MEILHITENKLKLSLTREEIAHYRLSGKRVEEWGNVREKLGEILRGSTVHSSFLSGRLYVQAYPLRDGGCELFVTRLVLPQHAVDATDAEELGQKEEASCISSDTLPQKKAQRVRKAISAKKHGRKSSVLKKTQSTESLADAKKEGTPLSAKKPKTSMIFRFHAREDLVDAAAAYPRLVKNATLYRLPPSCFLLVTGTRGFPAASVTPIMPFHPFLEFAELMPVGVLECLPEHAERIRLSDLDVCG